MKKGEQGRKRRVAYMLAVTLLISSSFGVSYAGTDLPVEKQSEAQSELQKQENAKKEKENEPAQETESETQSEPQKETESEKQSESQKETKQGNVERQNVLTSVRAYLLQKNSNPDFSSIWNVIGLQRSGMEVSEAYRKTFYQNVYTYCEQKNWILTRTKYSDYSKLIMALTSIGIDAQDVGGHNLFEYLADYENVKMQGINGPIWALIALNCHPSYSIPEKKEAEVQTTEELLVQAVLEAQCPDGGWNLAGGQGDSDMTGMALQALSFYYGTRTDVTAAVNRALAWISENQPEKNRKTAVIQRRQTNLVTEAIVEQVPEVPYSLFIKKQKPKGLL